MYFEEEGEEIRQINLSRGREILGAVISQEGTRMGWAGLSGSKRVALTEAYTM
jgi:hypothetical protein